MSMTEPDTLRVKAYRRSAAMMPIVPQEEIDRRAEARAMADDLRQTSALQRIEERIGISRTADASSGPWKYPTRKAKQPLCSGWWMMPAAAVCGAAWAGLFKWLGWW